MKFINLFIIFILLIGLGSAYTSGPIDMRTGANITLSGGYIHGMVNGTAAQDAVTYSQMVAGSTAKDIIMTYINTSGSNVYEYARDGSLIKSRAVSNASGMHDILENAINRGGNIHLGAGTYNIGTNWINVTGNGLEWHIKGVANKTIIKGSGTHVFYYPITSATISYRRTGTLEDLTIDGSSVANGLYINNWYCWTTITNNVRIQNCAKAVWNNGSVSLAFIDTHINNSAMGYDLNGHDHAINAIQIIRPCIEIITTQGIYIHGQVDGSTIGQGGSIEQCGNRSVYLYMENAKIPSGNLISEIWFEDSGSDAFIVLGGTGGTSSWYGPRGNRFLYNTFHCGSSVDAFAIDRGRHNLFEGNVCYGTSSSTHFDIHFTANTEANLALNNLALDYGHWTETNTGTSNVFANNVVA